MSKLAFGIAGIGGVAGTGAIVAYQTGIFSSKEKKESLTVREALVKEGYELVVDDTKFQEFFKEFKSDEKFMEEVDKHKKTGEDLENDSNGDKGKLALKSLCNSYLASKNNLDSAIKWCVLKIKDKPLTNSKTWRDIAKDSSDQSGWETAFNSAKNKMIEHKVKGVDKGTNQDLGYSILKTWCSENKKLPINNENKIIQSNVISWCVN